MLILMENPRLSGYKRAKILVTGINVAHMFVEIMAARYRRSYILFGSSISQCFGADPSAVPPMPSNDIFFGCHPGKDKG